MLQLSLRKQLGALQINVDITMPARGVLALFGRSGCGKTSTINMLAGLLAPDAGRVQLDQMTVFDSAHGVNLPIEARRIGYVFQQPRLFPHLSVDGNLRYGLKRAQTTSSQPFSYDTIVDLLGIRALLTRRPQQLSGGEQQRVAIGRALLAQPQLLLLDEPLASLDQARRNDILPYLERVRDDLGLPMIYISHQFEEVLQLATQVALMEDGKVLAQGTPAEISHHAALAAIIGDEAMGTIIDSHVTAIDADTSLAQIPVGHGRLQVNARQLQIGQTVRLQLLARDLILATEPPRGLSVRNQLAGQVTRIEMTEQQAVNVAVDVGGITLIARITRAAATDLRIESGMPIWLLIKAVSLRSHVYGPGTHPQTRP